MDQLSGGSGEDVLAGGSENDTLDGGPGRDEYFGETGADIIISRDSNAGGLLRRGDDRVDNDFTDIIAECERGTDNDGDGFSTAVDCNDAVAGIFPGAPDALENGVDEDCDGQDDRNLDRDGDTFPVPLDCNDAGPEIRPGTVEIRGNKVDENCDQRALPFAPLASLISTRWQITSDVTRLRKLIVRNAPAGARVAVTCDGPGCTFRKLQDRAGQARPRAGAPAPVLRQGPAPPGRARRRPDHRGGHDRALLPLQDRAQRAPGRQDQVPRARLEQGARMLKRRLCTALAAARALALWAPAGAQAIGVFSHRGDDDHVHRASRATPTRSPRFATADQLPVHALRRRGDRPLAPGLRLPRRREQPAWSTARRPA